MRAFFGKLGHWEDAARLAFFLFVFFGTGCVFILTPSLFPSALISALLFFIFSPLIDAFERKGISRTGAILALFLVMGSCITLTATWMTPRVSQEVETFQQGSSRYATFITERLKGQERQFLGSFPMFKDTKLAEKTLAWVQRSAQKIWSIAPNLASNLLICMLLVPFLTFILLKDAHEIRRSLLKLVPNRYFETVYSLMSRILDEMGGYVAARILEAALVTLLVTVGCLIFKIPYATLLGVFAGATNAIPYIGPLLGAAPGILLAILDPQVNSQLIWVTVVYGVANIIDTVVIFPLVVAKIVDLHPVVVVLSVMLGSELFGIVGMVIAVPITSIFKILIQEAYSRVYNHQENLR